ncbi:cardiac-enriched FHL2-interacting protein [Echinops telfairi]|uniref:Cardiac-enriched FHL2-interacting protein n=2 Tax=Echinops telfairi TaxID=9371 RepID=A0ABM0J710_ECHTE|nr:cardiac-enriched FHL2-interacting protein [Echinops telfairi]XP_045139633.1 cardiac-enriched FHL2-interacting protein [Echinops telfairi]
MQGNKKGTDGFSDSSSIGSLLDDADREVSSLTDRAFRSLCISEDTHFSESPDLTCQVLGGLHQGTVSHTQRKSGIWNQLPSQGAEHTGWAATLQQLPKYVQGEEKYPKGSPPPTPAQRKLEVPVSGLRSSSKPLSKVSSLIKSFDRPESQYGDIRPSSSKPPTLKTTPKFAPLPESGVHFCFDSAFLTVRRVPAEVSSTHQSSHQAGRMHREQESPKNSPAVCHSSSNFLPAPSDGPGSFESKFLSPAQKPAKVEPTRGNEWAHKGTFLHSENSAFESWNAIQPRVLKTNELAKAIPESKGPKYYQTVPLLRESHLPESKVSPSQVQTGCNQEERVLTISRPWSSRDPGAQVSTVEEKASNSQSDLQRKPTQPPWRKTKTHKGGKESLDDASEEKKQPDKRTSPLYVNQNPQGQFPEDKAPELPVDPREHYTPPFNISKLLTPIIPTKHVLDSLNSQSTEIPSPQGQSNGYQEKEPDEGQSWDSYKSKAPSLLFNLKDVRKHVKSTYSPNRLLKGVDVKDVDEKVSDKVNGKQEIVTNGVIFPNRLVDSPTGQFSKERTSDVLTAPYVSTQKDLRANANASSADNYPTPSSPPTTVKASFCVNGEATETHGCENNANGEANLNLTRQGRGPDSSQHSLRKHLFLKFSSQEPETAKRAEMLQAHQVQNGFSRSDSQPKEPDQEANLQSPTSQQRPSPGPLSPEEEDVFYSDSQSDFMPSLQSKAKFSTSSSDQSFASFEDQQKIWCINSPQTDKKNHVGAGESQRNEESVRERDRQLCSDLNNGNMCTDDISQGAGLQSGDGSVSGGTPRKASIEEASLRDSWVGKSQAPPQAADFTVAPCSTSNKHILFALKDNTLRATPIIKPIMLPLLRTLSLEDSSSSGHKERESPRLTEESQEIPSTPALTHPVPANTQDMHWRPTVHQDPEDHQPTPGMAKSETSHPSEKGDLPHPPLLPKVVVGGSRRSSTDQVRPNALKFMSKIDFAEDDTEGKSPPDLQGMCWEVQMQDFKNNVLSTPRAGALGKSLVSSEMVASPNPSSLEGTSVCSLTASSIRDDASQTPSELGLPPQERPPQGSRRASPSPIPVTQKEDQPHTLLLEDTCDSQLDTTRDLRPFSLRDSLVDTVSNSADLPERSEPPGQLERSLGKPPAVPPKTEKALRRAKKLANKRRKIDQGQGRPGEFWEERPRVENSKRAEWRPPSPEETARQTSFPSVRSLPSPMHRHSASSFSEHNRRRTRELQLAKPLLPYPATHKVLQDPQSGEYFVFDLPLQVKIKTFYDPETDQYFKVPIPSSTGDCPEAPLADGLTDPHLLFPGLQPLPVTPLAPLRCSSQLSTPTFLEESPSRTTKVATVGHQGPHKAGRQCVPQVSRDSTQNMPGQCPEQPLQNSEEEGRDAPNLELITINDLEDFATEGIS